MSVALELFQELRLLDESLSTLRSQCPLGCPLWVGLDDAMQHVDGMIERLMYSQGLGGTDDAQLPLLASD